MLALGLLGTTLLAGRAGRLTRVGHGRGRAGGGEAHEHAPSRLADPTALLTDPVTGREVDTTRASASVFRGRVYYFETPDSRRQFEASPERYAGRAVGGPLPGADGANRRHGAGHRGC